MKVENSYIISLPEITDGVDGKISIAEGLKNIPFEIKRVYYIYDLENAGAIRGKHAHKKLEQVIFCIHGSFKLGLDDGKCKEEILMESRNTGIYLGTGLWHTMTQFSKDCVLLVLASDYYSESDYIRDYSEFTRYGQSGKHDSSK